MNHTAISPMNAVVGRQKPAPATGTERTSPIRSLRSTLASEWIKLLTLRSTAALLGLTTVVGGLVVAGLTRAAPDLSPTIAEGLAYPIVFSAVFAAVAGISMFTSDIQHGTLEPTLIAQPSRTTIAAAKVLIAAAFGTAVAGLSQVGGLAGGFIAGTELGDLSTIAQRALWAMLFVSLASIIGLGVGMLARHSAAAISGLLVWWLVVENLIVALAPARIARFLPFVAGNAMVGIDMDSPDTNLAALTLTRPQDALLLAAYAAATLVAGTLILQRTEAR